MQHPEKSSRKKYESSVLKISQALNAACKSKDVLGSVSAYTLFQQATNYQPTHQQLMTSLFRCFPMANESKLILLNVVAGMVGQFFGVHTLSTILLVDVICCVDWNLVYDIT